MKHIIVEVTEGGHRYHSLIEFLRRDNYVFSTQQNLQQANFSSSLPSTEAEIRSYGEQVWNRAVEATLSEANNLFNVQPYLDFKVPFIYKKFKRQ